MELFIILLLALIVLGIAAPRWGFDSRDTFNSAEWGRRNEVSRKNGRMMQSDLATSSHRA
jgi:hypothetical protein